MAGPAPPEKIICALKYCRQNNDAVESLGDHMHEEPSLLRARFNSLLQGLQLTQDQNPETIDALKRIFPGWTAAMGRSVDRLPREEAPRRPNVAA